jgi:hypothetical protein
MWTGDRCDYPAWLQERLFPFDWKGQSRVLRLLYSECLPLSFDPPTDLALIRTHLAAEALRKNTNENDSKK